MSFDPKSHLISLKGKDYLQVMWRLVWFREDKPLWCIETTLVEHVPGELAVFAAKIIDDNGSIKSSGYGSETKKDFVDYLEKAETKAVGRALAVLGYGTQFAPDLDEGERIVDSPVDRKSYAITDKIKDLRAQIKKLVPDEAKLESSCRKTYNKSFIALGSDELEDILARLASA